jgi:UDP-N-acetylglucosamine transferase subunit ALG13
LAGSSEPTVFVTVGSDHHPFSRVIDWVGQWHRRHPDVRVLAQHGPAPVPPAFESYDFLDHAHLLAFMAEASAVVTHGGPTTIVEARRHGHVPIAVPRRRHLGEVVDDHQVGFCARLAELGHAVVPDDPAALFIALDRALETPRCAVAGAPSSDVARTVAQFAGLVDDLLVRDGGRRRRERGVVVASRVSNARVSSSHVVRSSRVDGV